MIVKLTWAKTGEDIQGYKIYRNNVLIQTISDENVLEYYDDTETFTNSTNSLADLKVRYKIVGYAGSKDYPLDSTASKMHNLFKYSRFDGVGATFDAERINCRYKNNYWNSWDDQAQLSHPWTSNIDYSHHLYSIIESTLAGYTEFTINMYNLGVKDIDIIGMRIIRNNEANNTDKATDFTWKIYGFNAADHSDKVLLATYIPTAEELIGKSLTDVEFGSVVKYSGYSISCSFNALEDVTQFYHTCDYIDMITKL